MGWLAFPRVMVVAALLAAAIGLPALWVGFYADDLVHLEAVEQGKFAAAGRWDLYSFVSGDPADAETHIGDGGYAWWTERTVRARFLRPLSSALFNLDHALFGRSPLGYHVTTLGWYVALVVAVGLLLWRVLPHPAAPLALLLFAVDDGHAFQATWIASRHVTIALLPAVLALHAHLRAREDGWRPGRWLAPLGMALAFGGGEVGVTMLGYFVAYEAVPRRGEPLGERLRALAPLGALLVAYVALRSGLGYGTAGSGVYVDPARDPVRYLAMAPPRLAVLVGSAVTGLFADLYLVLPSARSLLVAIGAGSLALFVPIWWTTRRSLEAEAARAMGWLTAGAVVTLLPSLGGAIGSRLVAGASVGMSAVLALVLHGAWLALRRGRWWRRLGNGATLAWLGLVHVPLSCVLFLAQQRIFLVHGQSSRRIVGGAGIEARHHVVLLQVNDPVIFLDGALMPAERPRTFRSISMAPYPIAVTRTADRTLEIAPRGGRLLTTEFERVLRATPMKTGDTVRTDTLTVRVLDATPDGSVGRIALDFAMPLDHPDLLLLTTSKDAKLVPVTPPPVGASIELWGGEQPPPM